MCCGLFNWVLFSFKKPIPRVTIEAPTPENDPSIKPFAYKKPKMQARDEGRKYHGGYTAAEFLAAEREAELAGENSEPRVIGFTGEGTIDYDDPSLNFITEMEGIRD